jgi:F0F1-type ATP synthase epsilon subunit
MPDLLRLSVLTPGKTLLDVANVSKVRLKLVDGGWLSIYPHHAPLLAETQAGAVTYITEVGDGTETVSSLTLSESILQVAESGVTLFTGGELTASTAMMGEEDGEDAVHFDRLARVLMLSLQAMPAETSDDFEAGGAHV